MRPRALKPGDQIRFVSPASPIDREKVANMEAFLVAEGYRVTYGPHAFDRLPYLAGSDQDRAADLQEAFDDPEVACVFCTRGGYGCARLMPHLDLDRMAASGKLFVGFSDITTLHLALNRRGLPTVHGPMALSLSVEREPWVFESLRRVMRGDCSIPEGAPKGECLKPGRATGVVTGGCLCLICDAIGTPDPPDVEGKIVLIEDVDEPPHRVDALLTHLLNAGLLQRAEGLVIGEMTRTDEKADESIGGLGWRNIVVDRLAGLSIPTVLGFPFGHCRNMLSLPLGIRAELDAGAGALRYTENLCG
ncbi:MAG: LD-carboxypeptidase [Armatimonadetes bacterium]|nr:LD-carboxypeptidase [Armatimonadota bacterium]